MIALLYQTWPRGQPEGFRALADEDKVGELAFNQVQFSPTRFLRGLELLVGEGRDFLSLQVQLAGEERLIMAHGHVRLLAGHVYLRDWGVRLRRGGHGDAAERHHDSAPSAAGRRRHAGAHPGPVLVQGRP